MARNLTDDGWRVVDLLDEVGSTNAFALRAPQPWHLVAAHEQTAGRGRLDRSWEVPAGSAVTMSMTLPLPADTSSWGWVPLFVGDAVRAALAAIVDDVADSDEVVADDRQVASERRIATKWPNDVLLRDPDGEWRKVCGVLCQVATGSEPLVVAGVGINVSQNREQLPVDTATSLTLAGLAVTRDEVIERVAHEVRASALVWSASDRAALAALETRVREHCRTIGHDIDVHTPEGDVIRRRGSAIDDDGRLVTLAPGSRPGDAPTMVFAVADVVHARLA